VACYQILKGGGERLVFGGLCGKENMGFGGR